MTKRIKRPRSPLTSVLIAETLELMHIAAQSEEFGAKCHLWTGAVSGNGYPIMHRRAKGCGCELVRRVVVELAGDQNGVRTLKPRQPVAAECNEKLCISPKCLLVATASEVGKRAAAQGAFSGIGRRSKIAATRRAQSKLTAEQALEIRLSSESGPVLSARYGVHRTTINNIKRGLRWRDFGGHFAGLGQRA